ncbi:DNA 5' exonuclease [Schizosaccharomyces octosporus yFS286]|uniref:DNA 5' exonuclease n=1 Tax=Schizosaccharomyces octosporus (strain yFS286) TaxID=483514 RepID=S9Q067_SCHOY|nr:DNA 5' exonuclease [Schizosaccharomyces octosporus yFS286]EPX74716.1 DNA 5' exonuclease [Schizosaccharomyces octosporus yFS286]
MSKRKTSTITDFFQKNNSGRNIWGNEAAAIEASQKEAKTKTNSLQVEGISPEALERFNDPSIKLENVEPPQWTPQNETGFLEPIKSSSYENEKVSMPEVMLCPVCQIDFSTLSVDPNEHVNACLDGRTPETFAKNAKKRLFLSLESSNDADTIVVDPRSTPTVDANKPIKKSSLAPFYKIMPYNMPFAVDAFSFGDIDGVEAYFLSHFHADHYGGLSSKWEHGPIYCSEVTGNLLVNILHVDEKYVHRLSLNEPHNILGVTVYLIDANHCPGSAMFLFETLHENKTKRVLHCGDFRASKAHVTHPALKDKTIHKLYLDTTYLNPKYTFPAQKHVVEACARKALDVKNAANSKLLVVVSTYSIGKEKVAVAIAKSLSSKIFVVPRKRLIIEQLGDQELLDLLTDDPTQASVHMVTMGGIQPSSLLEYLEQHNSFERVIGYRVTGWTFQPLEKRADLSSNLDSIISRPPKFVSHDLRAMRGASEKVAAFVAPYSEHSSFYELTMFCLSMNILTTIPTVNMGSQRSREKMQVWLDRWAWRRKKQGLLSVDDTNW